MTWIRFFITGLAAVTLSGVLQDILPCPCPNLLPMGFPVTTAGAAEPVSRPAVADIQIRIQPSGDGAIDEAMWDVIVRDLLPVKKGEPYSLAAIEESITALKDARLFQAIHIPDPVKTRAGMVIAFELTPFRRIKDIRIKNAFPIFRREVENVMHMEVGGPFDPGVMAKQAGRIQQFFRQQGFPRAQARVTAEQDKKNGYVVVTVDITKGPYQKIRAVRFQGNHAVSSLRLRLSTQAWRSTLLFGTARRIIPRELKEDAKALTALYRRKGYPEVIVTAGIRDTGKDGEVDVVFTLEEGPLYDIRFQGNDTLSDRALNREMTLDREGNQNNFALKKSLRNIKKQYSEKGFAQAAIREAGPGTEQGEINTGVGRRVDIRIDEGPRYRVDQLTITGNQTLSRQAVLENILTPGPGGIFNDKVLKDDAAAVQTLYLKAGFPWAEVKPKVAARDSDDGKTRYVTVDLAITEGPRTRVAHLSFPGLSALSRDAALSLLTLKPGGFFDPTAGDKDSSALEQAVSEAGYPHVRVSVETTFSKDRSKADIAYHIQEGPKVRIGRIFYVGNLRTREEILAREMTLAPKDPFVLSKIVESRRRILNLSAVDSARIRSVGLKTREEEVDLIVEISERKPYFVELGSGYDTERHLYLTTGIGDRNLFGRNLNLQSGAEVSQIGYKLDLSLTEPRFLASDLVSHTRMFAEEREEFNKDFGIRTYGLSQDFIKPLDNWHMALNLGAAYEFRDQYLTVDRTLTDQEASEYRTRHIGAISPGITYRTTDSYIRPRKGILATANLDLSKGIDTDLDDFIKFRTDLRAYIPLAGPLTLALRGRYGHILPYGNNGQIPDDQLFFLGGTTTVRGFDENMLRVDAQGNAVGGLEMILGSAEARIDLGNNIEASLFYDAGSVSRIQGNATDDSFREGAGIGLRYQTPVGPIGFLYGWKLDPKPGESPGCFHFSMGYTF